MKKKILFGIIILFSLVSNAQKKVNALAFGGFSTDNFYMPNERTFDVYTVGLGYKGPKTSLFAYYNEGNLNKPINTHPWGNQYELDFYHKITKKTYYWLNYAYSNDYSLHFPKHRAMVGIWQNIGNGFGVSTGGSYYYYLYNIFIANVGLEKYMGKFWVEGKVYAFFREPKTKYAFQFNSRYFWKDVNYIQLTLMSGAAPDEPWITNGLVNLKAESARLSVSTYINKKQTIQLRSGLGYAYEEYQLNIWRNRYIGNVGLIFTIF